MFEVRWNRPFATNFFGQFVQAGGVMNVPASLAIQLHEEKAGWVCDQIKEAKLSLDAGNTTIDGVQVSIDEVSPAGTPVTVEVGGETVEGELAEQHPELPAQAELVGPAEEAIITPTPELRPAQETVVAPAEGGVVVPDAPVPDPDEKPASPAVKAAKAEAAKSRRSQNHQK